MKISFDFDGCLSRADIQKTCLMFINAGYDVWITTSRWENPNIGNNNDLLAVAKNLGINKIQYTAHQKKRGYLTTFDYHYDDNPNELPLINCIGILV